MELVYPGSHCKYHISIGVCPDFSSLKIMLMLWWSELEWLYFTANLISRLFCQIRIPGFLIKTLKDFLYMKPGPLQTSFTELGLRQFCRDNVTKLSGHKVICNCHFIIFIVATPSRHWGLTIFRFFLVPDWSLRLYYVVTLLLSRS